MLTAGCLKVKYEPAMQLTWLFPLQRLMLCGEIVILNCFVFMSAQG